MAEWSAARDSALRKLVLVVADAIRAGAFEAAGRISGRQWLRAYTDMPSDEVFRVLSVGRLLALHSLTRAAVESGRLSIGRATVIAAAVTDRRRADYQRAEESLLDVFSSQARTGELDAPTAHLLRTALESCDTGPDPVSGPIAPRPLSRRRADALNTVARHALYAVRGGRAADEGDEGSASADPVPGSGDDPTAAGTVPAPGAPAPPATPSSPPRSVSRSCHSFVRPGRRTW